MFERLAHRAFSFALAALLTAGMLGGVDQIFQPEQAAPQWAQQANSPRA